MREGEEKGKQEGWEREGRRREEKGVEERGGKWREERGIKGRGGREGEERREIWAVSNGHQLMLRVFGTDISMF